MHVDGWTLALQVVNFAVLVWLLRRFLYEPVLRMVAARKAEVQRQLDRAKTVEDQAAAHLAAAQADRASFAAQRESLLKTAANQAQQAAQAVHQRADRDAHAVVDGARETVAAERKQLLQEARHSALDLGADYARRLLAEVPMAMSSEGWFERVERQLKVLPRGELDALAGQLADGGALTIATATAVPRQTAEMWSNRLAEVLGINIRVRYEVEPELGAGVELHFPTAVLRFSLQSTLDALRSGIESDDHANR